MAKLVGDVAPFDITEVAHAAHEFLAEWIVVRGSRPDVPDTRQLARPLRARRERLYPRATEQRDERAPFHSIISSARVSTPQSQSPTRDTSLLGRINIATNGDVGCGERSIRLLLCGGDEYLGSDLEVLGTSWRVTRNRGTRGHDDFLLTVLVFDEQILAILSGNGRRDIGISHGAAGPAVPRSMSIGHNAALRIHEDVNCERLLSPIRLRHGRYADECTFFNIG